MPKEICGYCYEPKDECFCDGYDDIETKEEKKEVEKVVQTDTKNHLEWDRDSNNRFYSLDDIIFPPSFKDLKKLWDYLQELNSKDECEYKKININCKLTKEGKTMFRDAILACYIEEVNYGETQNDAEDRLQVNLGVTTPDVDFFEFNVLSLSKEECKKDVKGVRHIDSKMDKSFSDKTICKICFKNDECCECDDVTVHSFFQTNNGVCILCNKELPVNPVVKAFRKCEHELHQVCLLKYNSSRCSDLCPKKCC